MHQPFLDNIDPSTLTPMSGVALIALDPIPDHIGSLFIPDSARTQKATDISHTGVVLAAGYGEFWRKEEGKEKWYGGIEEYDIPAGTRVVFRLLMNELNVKRALIDVRRIDAVVEGQ